MGDCNYNKIILMGLLSNAVTGVATVVDAATLVDKNIDWFKFFLNKHFKRRIRILVYGDSGVGKTQFLNTLTGKDSYTAPLRTRHLEHYDFMLWSGRRIRLIDTPGHKSSVLIRGQALDEMTKGKIDGIINLVDYGYQDSEQLQENPDKAFKAGSSEVKQEYLKENRILEKERTQEIINRITSNVRIKWFITIINKADIWNNERESVLSYYEGLEFYSVMEHLEHSTKVALCPFCSVITPFGNKPMQISYGERDKRKDYNNLIRTIEEFVEGIHE